MRSQSGFEQSDVPPGLVVALAGGLAFTIAAVLLILWFAYPYADTYRERGFTKPPPPAPRLESDPVAPLREYRAVESHRLRNYAPAPNGAVGVPVERAMRTVAAEGWGQSK